MSTITILFTRVDEPDTYWILDLIGIYFQYLYLSLKMCAFDPLSTCIHDNVTIFVDAWTGIF